METGSEPLEDAKRERFSKLRAEGLSAAAAFKKVFPHVSDATAETKGPAMARESQVKVRVLWYREKVKEKAAAKALNAVMDMAEKRMFLAAVVRTPLGDIDEKSPLCQEMTRTRKAVGRGEEAEEWELEKVKKPSALEAIKIDNDMAGDGSEAGAHDAIITLAEQLSNVRTKKRL